ncbi:MAG TPA: methylmalonyl-CoA epimerase [Gemmatimonadales bacterium]|nr:methylmalonyl-CoA epimerase [Gemmatimonadales bacterium]
MLPPEVQRDAALAHVGVAVRDLAAAVAFYRDVLGVAPGAPQASDGATIVCLEVGGAAVELLTSADPASPIGKFLARRGPGIHHLCFRVPDLDAALARCRAAGYRLIDEFPRPGAGGHRVAFIHPTATGGILLELSD